MLTVKRGGGNNKCIRAKPSNMSCKEIEAINYWLNVKFTQSHKTTEHNLKHELFLFGTDSHFYFYRHGGFPKEKIKTPIKFSLRSKTELVPETYAVFYFRDFEFHKASLRTKPSPDDTSNSFDTRVLHFKSC